MPMPAAPADASHPAGEPSVHFGSTAVPRVRLGIETISDVVFGLSLEIGSIALVAKLPQSGADLTSDIVEFGFSFIIIFMVWFAYRRAVVSLPHETQRTLIANVALLFCVSIEPFLFYVLVVGSESVTGAASVAFALDVGAMMLLLSVLYYLLLAEERNAPSGHAHPAVLRQIRVSGVGRTVVALVFFVSALPSFAGPGILSLTIREDVWIIALGLFFAVQYGAPLVSRQKIPAKN